MARFRNTDMLSLLERIDPQYREFRLLTEDQAGKSIDAAKRLVMQRLGYDEAKADEEAAAAQAQDEEVEVAQPK